MICLPVRTMWPGKVPQKICSLSIWTPAASPGRVLRSAMSSNRIEICCATFPDRRLSYLFSLTKSNIELMLPTSIQINTFRHNGNFCYILSLLSKLCSLSLKFSRLPANHWLMEAQESSNGCIRSEKSEGHCDHCKIATTGFIKVF